MAFNVAQMVWLTHLTEQIEAYKRGLQAMHVEQGVVLQSMEKSAARIEDAANALEGR
jgi:hypothetical protein